MDERKRKMKNDQWFEPGDKVMRVTYADDLGLLANVSAGLDAMGLD